MGVDEAAEALAGGRLLVHPTRSVYGLGGTLHDEPLAALRRAKARSRGGFVVLVPGARSLDPLLERAGRELRAQARALAEAFWPGRLTLVLDDPDDLFHPAAKAPDGTVAVRAPGHPLTRKLLRACGLPLTSTSANLPGEFPARTAAQARAAARALGLRPAVLDGGALRGGAPSTLLRLSRSGPAMIREGRVTAAEVTEVLGRRPRTAAAP